MRRATRLVLLGAALGLTLLGCSGDGGGALANLPAVGGPEAEAACTHVGRLAESAEPLLEAGVDDPEAFRAALDTAVLEMVTILDALAESVPPDLVDDVTSMRGLVEQHLFQEAIVARAAVDEWARRACT